MKYLLLTVSIALFGLIQAAPKPETTEESNLQCEPNQVVGYAGTCNPFVKNTPDCHVVRKCVSVFMRDSHHVGGESRYSYDVSTSRTTAQANNELQCVGEQVVAYAKSNCTYSRSSVDCRRKLECIWVRPGDLDIGLTIGQRDNLEITYSEEHLPTPDPEEDVCHDGKVPQYAQGSCRYAKDSIDCAYDFICVVNGTQSSNPGRNSVPNYGITVYEAPSEVPAGVNCGPRQRPVQKSQCSTGVRDPVDCLAHWECENVRT